MPAINLSTPLFLINIRHLDRHAREAVGVNASNQSFNPFFFNFIRHLARHAREAVGVYASGIHGRGLFCKREISAGEMVGYFTVFFKLVSGPEFLDWIFKII